MTPGLPVRVVPAGVPWSAQCQARTVPVVDVQGAVGAILEGVDPLRAPLHVGDDHRVAGEGDARGRALVGPVPDATVPVVDVQVVVGAAVEGVDSLRAPLQVGDDPRIAGEGRARGGALVGPEWAMGSVGPEWAMGSVGHEWAMGSDRVSS